MSNLPVFVRTATKRDLPAIRALLVEAWHTTYDAILGLEAVNEITENWHSIEALERRLSVPASEFIVADDGEIFHGMAFANQAEKTVHLHQLYILPTSKGRGIGTELMQEIFFCFDSAETISLEVHPENTGAIGFYKAGGFAQIGTTENCGRDNSTIPALILTRKLDF